MTDIQWMPATEMLSMQSPKLELRQQILCTPKQAQQYLAIGCTMLYQLLSDGSLRSIKVGKARRIVVESLFDYVRDMESYEFGVLKGGN